MQKGGIGALVGIGEEWAGDSGVVCECGREYGERAGGGGCGGGENGC